MFFKGNNQLKFGIIIKINLDAADNDEQIDNYDWPYVWILFIQIRIQFFETTNQYSFLLLALIETYSVYQGILY